MFPEIPLELRISYPFIITLVFFIYLCLPLGQIFHQPCSLGLILRLFLKDGQIIGLELCHVIEALLEVGRRRFFSVGVGVSLAVDGVI